MKKIQMKHSNKEKTSYGLQHRKVFRQGPAEPFMSFIDRLTQAVDRQYSGCATQLFFFFLFMGAELALLTIMCYDRYVSICKPLHYGTLLGSRACACEIPQILKLSCSHSNLREVWLLALGACLVFVCFVFIVFSYVQIFRVVLRIPSEQGRQKAFSTCLPHLVVISLFLSTGTFAYLKPPSMSSPSLDLALSVLYSVVTPALNPLMYSLRNQELKAAVWRL
ncbi:olfactory receptor 14J1-like, partial [Melospiza melodia melodia]|uniref:olfactory receptor 14J1-like n=1 Tax=Melospiza melodia melodia TaxID=1914991 RepID=UPI002FD73A0C